MNPPSQQGWLELADRVLAPTYSRPSILFTGGEGCTITSACGGTYLDMTSGIAVNALGHAAPEIQEALTQAARGLIHTSNLFHTQPAIELAAELTEHSFAARVFFCNSGAEANEGAIKFARLAGGPNRRRIGYFSGSFHGRTLGALAATDRPSAQAPFTPLPDGFFRMDWNDPNGLNSIDRTVAAVLVEPLQGEGGARLADAGWFKALAQRCQEAGALLICDEVQCGLGRTGKLWAHQHLGVQPDMMTLAKPLAGGLPMGAVLMTEEVASHVKPGAHATTFGGGPVVAAVAKAVFRWVRQPHLLQRVEQLGAHLRRRLQDLAGQGVQEVRGLGLLVGAQVSAPAAEVVSAALDEGLLVVAAANNTVRFIPALTVERAELDQAVELFASALERVVRRQEARK